MPDLSIERSSALGAFASSARPCAAAEFRALAAMARFVFRGRPAAIEKASQAFECALPDSICRAAVAGTRAALCLGPDEWTLLAPDTDRQAITRRFDAALGDVPHSLVDVSHRNTGLTIDGCQAAAVLNHGCPLDLSLPTFPIGMCTRTVLGKAEITLWRRAEVSFYLETGRSFGDYVWRFLEGARREFEE